MIIHCMWVTIISNGIVYCGLIIYLCYTYYHIAGFVCEVLICANYDVMGLQKLILCVLIILVYFCFLTRCRILHTHGYSTNCLLDCLPMSLYKYFKRLQLDISASLLDPKGPLSDHSYSP